ncbi:MAG: DUF5697 family protein [Clostridiaceae bacterium]|nr:DUF5697 family protein [Clostridiaceae bacterium]
MKTRADIYGQEATELLRLISLYPGLIQNQLDGFFPGKGDTVVAGLLSHLKRQGRIEQGSGGGWFPYGKTPQADPGLLQSVWVLLDVIDRVEHHSPGDFPAKIVFFSDGEIYEIIYAAVGREALISHALKQDARQDSRRIVLVEEPGQIPLFDFPNIAGFCTVSSSGQVLYYQRVNGGT